MLSTWHTCPWTEWYITHIPSRSAMSERVSTTLLCLHLLRWVRLKHYCSKHITDTHAGRNYRRDGINLWDLQRPLSSNKKCRSFAFFPFFFLLSTSQGVSQTTEILKISWVIIFLKSFPGFSNTCHACEILFIYKRMGNTQTLHLPSLSKQC